MAISLVQKSKANANATTLSVTLSGVAIGNFIPVILCTNGVQTLNSISDSAGATVNAAVPYTTQSVHAGLGIYFIENTSSGTHTVTATFAGTIYANLLAAEYSGVVTNGSFDVSSPVNFGSGTAIATGSVATTQGGDLVIFALATETNPATFSSYANGFVQEDASTAAPASAWADLTQMVAGNISGSVTASVSSGWAAAVAAFRAAQNQAESHFASPSTNCPF